jgi:hypothetical protein
MVEIDAARVKQELFDLGSGLAVNFNPHGRFHGWLFQQHPDGQYVSVRKLNKLEPFSNVNIATAPRRLCLTGK